MTVGGREATLIVWSPDYDGKGKAWVRFDDGEDAIVGGSRVERARAAPGALRVTWNGSGPAVTVRKGQ